MTTTAADGGRPKRKTLDAYFGAPAGKKPAKSPRAAPTEAPKAAPKKAPAAGPAEDQAAEPAELDASEYALELETIDASWLPHLRAELSKPSFRQLKKFLREQHEQGKQIFPPARDVYSWTRFAPLDGVRVVILGQDPYHGPGQAHGLAFSVRPGVRVPPSLANMYRALKSDYPGFAPPAHGYLGGWAQQGVLMLNAALTVEAHKANSHAGRGWEHLTDRAIELVNQRQENVVFMLWGSHAQKKGAKVDRKRHLVLTSVHPSPLSAHRGFLTAGHFRRANEYLAEHGLEPIDWAQLPADEVDPLAPSAGASR
ncbi:uracil DNA glycosylase [Coemansia nantahalensis]|uniref:Uracil DNA glycosylase n=1 Tax=Coemansia nantahalensis TaxID=2789366 RepID=A0ACC1K0G7_9FUNG|nr:uracil DNA glycosylase [Coemansia nantahalensis]